MDQASSESRGAEGDIWFRRAIKFMEFEELERAFACLSHAVELDPDNALVQFAMGQAYDSGIGVPADAYQAARWYRRSAESGLAGGQYFLGQKYESGQGVPYDPAEAMSWYTRAASQGLPEAQYALGEILLCAEGAGPARLRQAAYWFGLAASQGHSNAQLTLAGMYENGLGVEQDTQEHQARSVERLEQFNAARQMEALLPDDGTATGMIQ